MKFSPPLLRLSALCVGCMFGLFALAACAAPSAQVVPTITPAAAQVQSPRPIAQAQPTKTSVPPTPTSTPDPPRTDGATSPEEAALAYYKAIEANDANAYLDVIDPRLRSDTDNYFAQSQFLSALTQVIGLGGQIGKDSTKISFRDLSAKAIEMQDNRTTVQVSGVVRSLAYATEQPLYDKLLVRKIGGRWFVSKPTEQEVAVVAQATAQAQAEQVRLEAELREKQAKIVFNAILDKGEFVENMMCSGWTGYNIGALQRDNQWIPVSDLAPIAITQNGGSYPAGPFRLSPDRKLIAVQVEGQAGSPIINILDADGRNPRTVLRFDEAFHSARFARMDWSPDSQRLVVAADPQDQEGVFILDLSTGQVDTVWKGEVQSAIFLRDGRRIAMSYNAGQNKGVVSIYNPDTGDEQKIVELPLAPDDLVLSPDGNQIAFTDNGLWTVNVDGSNLKQVAQDARMTLPLWSPDSTLLVVHYSRSESIGLVPVDGTQPPIEVNFPNCSVTGNAWWIDGETSVVAARASKLEQDGEERTISVNLTNQLHGVEINFKEIQVTKEQLRIHLAIKNTGEQGRVFFSNPSAHVYIINQKDAATHDYGVLSINFPLTIPSDLPSTFPTGKVWEGWFEADVSVPVDALGIIVRLGEFEYEKAYPNINGVLVTTEEWVSEQKDQNPWYQPLNSSISEASPTTQGSATANSVTEGTPTPSTDSVSQQSQEKNLTSLVTASASSTLPAQNTPQLGLVRYDPRNVLDSDLTTSWVEGIESSSGVGEQLVLTFDKPITITRLGVDIGFDRDEQIFRANNRVRRAQLRFSDGSTQTVEFRDQRGIQYVPIQNVTTTSLIFVIDDIYPGTKYDDTAVAEVEVWGNENP